MEKTNGKTNKLFRYDALPDDLLVGGFNVVVYECDSGRPVTGAQLIASDFEDLRRQVLPMLARFEQSWLAQTPKQREANMRIAAKTKEELGW